MPVPVAPLTLEQFTGRLAALCAHPVAAWRVTSSGERRLIVLAYACAGYAAVLAALVAWG